MDEIFYLFVPGFLPKATPDRRNVLYYARNHRTRPSPTPTCRRTAKTIIPDNCCLERSQHLNACHFSFTSVPFSLSPSLPSLPNEQPQPSPTSTLSQPDEEASADASPGLSTRARGTTERLWQHQHIDDDGTLVDGFYRATNALQARRPGPSTLNHQPIHPRSPSTLFSDRSFDRSPAASPGPILDHPILARLAFGSPLSPHKPWSTHPDVILPDVHAFLLLNLFSDALTGPVSAVTEPGWGRHSRRPLAHSCV